MRSMHSWRDYTNSMAFEKLWMVGLDERVALPLREKYRSKVVSWPIPKVEEMVVVSTCQRQEVYWVGEKDSCVVVEEVFFPDFPREVPLQRLGGKEVVRHLFRVACGVESLALGESQVLGQVKRSWEKARCQEWCGKVLNRLFLRAVTLGKKVRATTNLGSTSLSVGALAIQFAERFLGDLRGKRVFLIGTGEMGRILLQYLRERGVGEVRLSSKTTERARLFNAEFPEIRVFSWKDKYEYMKGCDMLISVTEAPHYTVDLPRFRAILPEAPRFLLDLGVPRNIDPAIGGVEGIGLFTLEDLRGVAEENRRRRMQELTRAEEMIEEEVDRFWSSLLWDLLFATLEHEFREIAGQEWQELIRDVPGLRQEEKAIMETLQRINRRFLVRFKEVFWMGKCSWRERI